MTPAKIYTTLGSLLGLMLILVTYNHCGIQPDTINKRVGRKVATVNDEVTNPLPNGSNTTENTEGTDSAGTESTPLPAQNPIVTQNVELGIKDYAMILENMSAVTGVDAASGNIQTVYQDVLNQLPSDNNVKSFLPSQQVAITKLAAEFCDALVENATLRTQLWPNINFTQGPATALSISNRQMIVRQTMARFWGDGIYPQTMLSAQEGHLLTLFTELLAGESTSSATVTRTAVKGVCMAVLASAPAELL